MMVAQEEPLKMTTDSAIAHMRNLVRSDQGVVLFWVLNRVWAEAYRKAMESRKPDDMAFVAGVDRAIAAVKEMASKKMNNEFSDVYKSPISSEQGEN